jgi:hypothetical protein
MTTNLICFANNRFYGALERIKRQATNLKIFNNFYFYKDTDLLNEHEFWNLHKNFIENNKRGYGYWIWKPYLILKTLKSLNDNDILIYLDSGCEINPNGINRIHEYIQMVRESDTGLVTFYLAHLEKSWTKMDLVKHLDADEFLNTKQILSGIFIIRKCENTMNIFNKWYELSFNYHFLNDDPSIEKNDPEYREHRHDQSILSLLCKKYGSVNLSDETYFEPNWFDGGKDKPFWAYRNTSSHSPPGF